MNTYTKKFVPFVYLLVWASGKMYVGSRTQKGKANPQELLKTYLTSSKVVKKYLKAGNTPIQVLVFPFETAQEAVEAETKMLMMFDAKNSGAFFNQHNGDGRFSTLGIPAWNKGQHWDETTKLKMSQAKNGVIPWNKGKTGIYTTETIKRISDSLIGNLPWNKGIKTGKIWVSNNIEEKLIKIVDFDKYESKGYFQGRLPRSVQTRKKISDVLRGKKRKPCSAETRKKISDTQKGRTISQERKDHLRRINLGKRTGMMTCFDIQIKDFVNISKEVYHENKSRYLAINSKQYKELKNQMV